MWLQSNVGIMDDNTVYEFKSAVRGYHFYRKDWKPVCNQLLFCSYEVGNPFDPFAIKVIVGHLPMEISRITKFLLDRGFAASLTLTSMHYRQEVSAGARWIGNSMQSENCNGYPNKTTAECSGSLQRTSTRILLRAVRWRRSSRIVC